MLMFLCWVVVFDCFDCLVLILVVYRLVVLWLFFELLGFLIVMVWLLF